MKQGKESARFLRPLIPLPSSLWAVAEPAQPLAMPVAAATSTEISPRVSQARMSTSVTLTTLRP